MRAMRWLKRWLAPDEVYVVTAPGGRVVEAHTTIQGATEACVGSNWGVAPEIPLVVD